MGNVPPPAVTRVRGAVLVRTKLKPQWEVHLGPTVVNIQIRRVLPLPNASFLRKPESGMVKLQATAIEAGNSGCRYDGGNPANPQECSFHYGFGLGRAL